MDIFKILGSIIVKNSEANDAIDQTTTKARKSSEDMAKSFKSVGEKSIELGKKMAIVSGAASGILGASVKFAADYKAMNAQFEQTFAGVADQAESAMQRVADSSGILETRLKGTGTKMYAFAKTTGMDTPEALDMMERALTATADSAAYYDRSIEDTAENLQSFLKGNFENDAALGLSCTETTRNAAANELYGKSFMELSESQKQLTLLQMVEDANKLSGAMGQAARESDGWENVMGNLKESVKMLGASLGEVILPTVTAFTQKATALITRFSGMNEGAKTFIVAVLGIAAAMSPMLIGFGTFMKLLGTITGKWSKFMGAMKKGLAFLTGHPIILIIAAVTVAVIALYKNSNKFRNAVNELGASLKSSLQPAFEALQQVFVAFKPLLSQIVSVFASLCTTVGNVLAPIITALTPLFTKVFTVLANQVKSKLKIVIAAINTLSKAAKLINKYLVKPVEKAYKTISKVLKNITKAFKSLKIKFPKFKTPELYIKWKDGDSKVLKALGLKGIPSIGVRWHALGGIFDQPTLLQSRSGALHGVGEAGAEAIAPISKLQEYVSAAVANQNAMLLQGLSDIFSQQGYTFNIATQVDGRSIAVATAKYTQAELNKLQQRSDRLQGVRV